MTAEYVADENGIMQFVSLTEHCFLLGKFCSQEKH